MWGYKEQQLRMKLTSADFYGLAMILEGFLLGEKSVLQQSLRVFF